MLLDQAAQSHIQPGLECLQGWGVHNLLGQPVPVCHHLCEKNFLLISDLNLPYLSLRPFPLVLSLSTLVNGHSPSCLYASFKHWEAAMRSPQSLLFSKLNKPSSLNLSSLERCSGALIISVPLLWTHSKSSTSFLYWVPRPGRSIPGGASQELNRGGQSPPSPCWPPLF